MSASLRDTSDYHARIWEAIPEGHAPPPDLELRRRFLLAHARAIVPREGEAPFALDVGCGEGQLTHELAQAGCRALGIDVAEEPLRRARARHPELDLRLVPADGAWPLPDAAFDLVWAGEVIEHVTDTLGFMSEVRRVLRSGGTFALTTPAYTRLSLLATALAPTPRALDRLLDPRSDHVRFYTRRSLRALLGEFGFEDLELRVQGRARVRARPVLLGSARRARFAG